MIVLENKVFKFYFTKITMIGYTITNAFIIIWVKSLLKIIYDYVPNTLTIISN